MVIDPTNDEKLKELRSRTAKLTERRERTRFELDQLRTQHVDLLQDPDAPIVAAGQKTPQHVQMESVIEQLDEAIERSRAEEHQRECEIREHNRGEFVAGRDELKAAILQAASQLRELVNRETKYLETASRSGVRFQPTLDGIGSGHVWTSPADFITNWLRAANEK